MKVDEMEYLNIHKVSLVCLVHFVDYEYITFLKLTQKSKRD